jgi:hydrogenase maturation protease
MHAEMLIAGAPGPVSVHLRFLHLLLRENEHGAWQEAMEREIVMETPGEQSFSFPAWREGERSQERLSGMVRFSIDPAGQDLWKVTVHLENITERECFEGVSRDEVSMQALIAAHVVADCPKGGFVSLTDPPEQHREAASDCKNIGVWPVLAGAEGSSDCMLAAPIILSDYPQVAPESPGDLFDSGEIDEILTLRILTLSDREKAEIAASDERARRIVERSESLSAGDLMRLHGVLRRPRAAGSGQ